MSFKKIQWTKQYTVFVLWVVKIWVKNKDVKTLSKSNSDGFYY